MMRPGIKSVFQKNLHASVVISDIVLALMMACVTYGVIQLVRSAVTSWNLNNLLWVSILITMEALYSRRIAKSLGATDEIIYRVSELIIIALLIKLMLYVFHGNILLLLADIPTWQESIVNFFPPDYLLTLVFIFGIWFLSTVIGNNLDKLHNLDENITWDTLSIFQKDFQATHASLLLQVMVIGLLVLLMAIVTRVTVDFSEQIRVNYTSSNEPVINVLVYFFLALIMLSQSQLATLRTRWWLDKIKISPKISNNWLLSAVIFFAFLTILAFLLPTDYSMGLLDTLRAIINFLLTVAKFLLSLLLFPFYLIASLFGVSTDIKPEPTQEPMAPMQAPSPVEPSITPDWFQVLKSFLFWGFLLFIVGYAVWQYFQHNERILEFLNKFSLFKTLRAFWSKFRQWLSGVNKNVSTYVRERIESFRRTSGNKIATKAARRIRFNQLSTRQKIIYLYQEFTRQGSQHGIIRKIFHTPHQYSKLADTALPNVSEDIDSLTNIFVDARYSGQEISDEQVKIIADDMIRISREIRSQNKEKNPPDKKE